MTDSTIPGTRFVHNSSDTVLVAHIEGLEEMGITQIKIPTPAYTVLSREPLVIQIPIRFGDLTVGEVPWHDARDTKERANPAYITDLTEGVRAVAHLKDNTRHFSKK